jgi:hypothetical protein
MIRLQESWSTRKRIPILAAGIDLVKLYMRRLTSFNPYKSKLDVCSELLTRVSYYISLPSPDTSSSAWNIADKINELALHVFTPKRERCDRVKPLVDCMVREQKLKSSTLNTLNRKVRTRSMLAGLRRGNRGRDG